MYLQGQTGPPSNLSFARWAATSNAKGWSGREKGVHGLLATEKGFKSNQIKSNYFIVRLKVDQRAGQLSLPHLGITKQKKNRTKT